MKKLITILLLCVLSVGANAQCVPTIHYDGCDLEVVGMGQYQSFQWYQATALSSIIVAIDDANEFTYEPIEQGIYMVLTVDQYGCANFSKRYKIINWCGVGKSKN